MDLRGFNVSTRNTQIKRIHADFTKGEVIVNRMRLCGREGVENRSRKGCPSS